MESRYQGYHPPLDIVGHVVWLCHWFTPSFSSAANRVRFAMSAGSYRENVKIPKTNTRLHSVLGAHVGQEGDIPETDSVWASNEAGWVQDSVA